MKKTPLIISILLLWLTSLACGQTAAVPTVDPNAAQTAIVETIVALQAQATPTTAAAPTLESSTATASPTVTPEPTGTPSVPMISVTVDTFCRTGPGKEYEKVGILLVGETTQIVGRDAFGQFWYVRNPDVGPEYCWMSGEFAIISGNPFSLLVQPVSGEAGINFEAEYRGQGKCSGEFWSDIRLKNLSRGTLQSIKLVVTDTETSDTHSSSGNEFAFRDGCAPVRVTSSIAADESVLISTPAFTYNLNAHKMSVSITLCTELNLTGQCTTKIITYTP
ncbi:MAG: SH3 domain-containing protein [Anaerolineales bacterium]|nr:MAG: SH3 domain-containing protein [Anaerolineales bacterium]